MSLDDEIYRQKYLKYKAKYLELKEQEGGVIYKPGQYLFFLNHDSTIPAKALKVPSLSKITNSTSSNEIIMDESFMNVNFNQLTDAIQTGHCFSYLIGDSKINTNRGGVTSLLNISSMTGKKNSFPLKTDNDNQKQILMFANQHYFYLINANSTLLAKLANSDFPNFIGKDSANTIANSLEYSKTNYSGNPKINPYFELIKEKNPIEITLRSSFKIDLVNNAKDLIESVNTLLKNEKEHEIDTLIFCEIGVRSSKIYYAFKI